MLVSPAEGQRYFATNTRLTLCTDVQDQGISGFLGSDCGSCKATSIIFLWRGALATDFGMMASALANQLTFFKVKKKNHFNLGARRSDRNGDNLFVDAKCFFLLQNIGVFF